MKNYLFATIFLLSAGLACRFNVDMGTSHAPAVTQGVVTQAINTEAVSTQAAKTQVAPSQENLDNFIQAEGRSPLDISSDLRPYLTQLGWIEFGMMESGIIVSAPQELGLRENGLAYHITFNTNGTRMLAVVVVEMYFIPEKVGTPFDEVYLFSGMNRDAPALSVYQDVEGNHRATFRGVYSFNKRLNVNDFMDYLNFYAASVDELLIKYPFFSKQ